MVGPRTVRGPARDELKGRGYGPARAAPYSTVTVFARLRGWSTFSPRRRAIS